MVKSATLAVLVGNAKLLAFYFKHLWLSFSLPCELYDERALEAKMEIGEPFEVVVEGGRDYVEDYTKGLEQLEAELHELGARVLMGFPLKQKVFWAIRFGCIACAFAGSFKLVFTVSLLQFLAMPYSLFAAVSYGLETVLVLYTGHALVFPLLTLLLQTLLPVQLNVTFPIGQRFLVAFLIVDQLLCTLCLFKTPKGKTAPIPSSRIIESATYGFLNCKTYILILLPLTFGFEVPVIAWVVDASLGISCKASSFISRFWGVLFYHQHRISHLKQAYPDAHKFHHHLHDCTAFDSHMFGSGAPEEWLMLMSDIALVSGLGCLPAFLSCHVLSVSWYGKWGFHSRSDKPAGHSDNFHADHHAFHTVNFGNSPIFDLFMNTLLPKSSEKTEFRGFTIERTEEGRTVRLHFTPAGDGSQPRLSPINRGSSGRNLMPRG